MNSARTTLSPTHTNAPAPATKPSGLRSRIVCGMNGRWRPVQMKVRLPAARMRENAS